VTVHSNNRQRSVKLAPGRKRGRYRVRNRRAERQESCHPYDLCPSESPNRGENSTTRRCGRKGLSYTMAQERQLLLT